MNRTHDDRSSVRSSSRLKAEMHSLQKNLGEAGHITAICNDLREFLRELDLGAGVAVLTDDAIHSADIRGLASWVRAQPPWSDFPFVLLTERGGGLERNPAAKRQMAAMGNLSFLERPFHPTTLISVVETALRTAAPIRTARSTGSVT